MPDSIVMLTDVLPRVGSRCTGVLLDAGHILTANHCAWLSRVETQYGQESYVLPIAEWPEIDIAILASIVPLHANRYAQLTPPDTTKPALIYGVCPHHWSHIARVANYLFDIVLNGQPTQYWVSGVGICGGDSGGTLVQDENVVAIIIEGDRVYPGSVYSQAAYVVSAQVILEAIADGQ